MIQTINFSQFCDSFLDSYKGNFSYEGKRALFDYLESCEEESGEPYELDTVALCCEFSEHESALDCAKQYGYEEGVDLESHGSVDLVEVAELEENQAIEWLQDRTQVILVEGGRIIIQQF